MDKPPRKLTAVIIPADSHRFIEIRDLDDPDFRDFQKLVGGTIEFVDVRHGGSFCCNDESKLIGLPVNPRATWLLWLMNPEYVGVDFLAGDAVLAGQPDSEGDTTSAPPLFVQLFAASPAG